MSIPKPSSNQIYPASPRFRFSLAAALLLMAGVFSQSAMAAVSFTVTPATVSNTYSGFVSLQASGLSGGDTVLVQKYLDLNSNGVIDADDLLVQQFQLTDNQAGMVIGGIVNSNVPGDTNPVSGTITSPLNFQNGDFVQNTVGQYLFKLSSPANHFTAITNVFSVTAASYAQEITGTVVSNNTATTLANAIIVLLKSGNSGNNAMGGVVANSAGSYTLQAPAGSYKILAIKSNYVATTEPSLTLTNGQLISTNLSMTNAATTIAGQMVDSTNSGLTLPGIFMTVKATNGFYFAATFTGSNGAFSVGVISNLGQWDISGESESLLVHGYLGSNTDTYAGAGQTNVSIAFPMATALFYGRVTNTSGGALGGVPINENDNGNNYDTEGVSDVNGYYSLGVLGEGDNDSWSIGVSSHNPYTNDMFSQPNFDNNGGINIDFEQALEVSFTGAIATNMISGTLKDQNNNPISGVEISATATNNGVEFQQSSQNTDSNGNYSVYVGNGTWSVGPNSGCCTCSGNLPCQDFPPTNQIVVINNNNGAANFVVLAVTTTITGTLMDNLGNPISNVGVNANNVNNQNGNGPYADTDDNGDYQLYVTNGTWQVCLNTCDNCGGDDYLPTNYLQPSCDTVTISNDNGTANFIAPIANNTISGTLKDGSGNPISGVGIYANGINGNNFNTGTVDTDSGGNYSLAVANGDWSVCVNTCENCGNSDYLPANYLPPGCQTVVISNDNGTANFVAVIPSNTICGTLTTNGGNGIGNVGIYANTTIGNQNYNLTATTASNGDYCISVINGAWQVGINTCSNCGFGYLPANYVPSTNQTVVIQNNNGTANFTALLAPDTISGWLRDTSNNPISDVGIYANAMIGNAGYTQFVNTDSNGNYSMFVANGLWTVGVNGCTNCNDGLPGNYSPPANQMVNISNDNGTAYFTVQNLSNCNGVIIDTTSLPSGQVNSNYNQYLSASSCYPSFAWSIISGSLPPGLNFYSSGQISGTPTNSGTYPFTVRVTDGQSNSTNQNLSIYIAPGSTPLQLTTPALLPSATQNAFYSDTLTATGGQPPYTWGMVPGSAPLPLGLSLATNGLISGTPISSGTNGFIIYVLDTNFDFAYTNFSLVVNPSTNAPKILLTAPERPGTNLFQFSFISASNESYTIQYSANLKTWTSLVTLTGSGGMETIIDPGAGPGARYYRVMTPLP